MSEKRMSKSKLDFLARHKKVFVVLPRQEANDYLLAHNFTEPEKNLLRKVRRNHQNKVALKIIDSVLESKLNLWKTQLFN